MPHAASQAVRAALALLALCASPTLAAAGPARYPFALRVETSRIAAGAQHVHGGPGFLDAPPCEASVTFVGKQASEVYQRLAERLFQANAPGTAQLLLEIETVRESVSLERDEAWHAIVVHDLSLRDQAGALLGHWSVEGRGRIEGAGERAVPEAFERANELAAQRFESRFEEPAGVVQWLQRSGVAAGTVARRLAAEEPPGPLPTPLVGPQRPAMVAYLDVGFALDPVSVAPYERGATDSITQGPAARLGLSGSWAFLQATFARWDSRDTNAEHELTSIGADLGPVLRFGRDFEIDAGVGLQAVTNEASVYGYGPQRVWTRTVSAVPSLVLALRVTPPIRGYRLRVSFETRFRFASLDSTVVAFGQQSAYSDHLDAPFAFALMIGGELPLGKVLR